VIEKPEIEKLAEKHGWNLVSVQDNIKLLIFRKGTSQINVYWSKMTVATIVDHPVKPRRQLYRKHVSSEELKRLFKNPRLHTRRGYYRR
jgi:hypothetical protein